MQAIANFGVILMCAKDDTTDALALATLFHSLWKEMQYRNLSRCRDNYPAYSAIGQRVQLFEALAKNPGAPRQVLALLSEDFPGLVLRNLAIPLLWLEDPGWCSDHFAERFCAELAKDAENERQRTLPCLARDV